MGTGRTLISRRSLIRAGAGAGPAVAAVGAGTAPVTAGSRDKWNRLRSAIQGDVVLPSDDGYALAKQGSSSSTTRLIRRPSPSAGRPRTCAPACLFTQVCGLPLRVRSGGHNLNGWSTGEGLIIDVGRIAHTTVTGRTVRVGPGSQSVDALSALAPLGLQLVTGTCPTVRAGGFISGGGVGFQDAPVRYRLRPGRLGQGGARRRPRSSTVSATSEPDLYWAVRGGGGGYFGIVVDFEVRPVEAPRMVTYNTLWSYEDAPAVIAALAGLDARGLQKAGLLTVRPAAGRRRLLGEPLIRIYGGHHGTEARRPRRWRNSPSGPACSRSAAPRTTTVSARR
ncbi:FAD-dependent oxidoreductase [Streptomyces thinghirensis]|nr:FAD-dependent oxidoreductase [Streptomyces thinghirensis]